MDVSVLIGKPLGALRPSPPITAWEEVNTHAHAHTHTHRVECQWSEGHSVASASLPPSPS